jgi:hypothetical protein
VDRDILALKTFSIPYLLIWRFNAQGSERCGLVIVAKRERAEAVSLTFLELVRDIRAAFVMWQAAVRLRAGRQYFGDSTIIYQSTAG